jgi:hypothetical protein
VAVLVLESSTLRLANWAEYVMVVLTAIPAVLAIGGGFGVLSNGTSRCRKGEVEAALPLRDCSSLREIDDRDALYMLAL